MGIMRWVVYNRRKEKFPNTTRTYGYLTKNTRIKAGMEKSHINDACCFGGNLKALGTNEQYRFGFKRKNNRQLHKANYLKGAGRRTTRHRISSKGFASWIGWTIRETPVLFLALEPGVISIFDSLKA